MDVWGTCKLTISHSYLFVNSLDTNYICADAETKANLENDVVLTVNGSREHVVLNRSIFHLNGQDANDDFCDSVWDDT